MRLAGFDMVFSVGVLAAAVAFARRRLMWLFIEGPVVSARGWQALLSQQLLPGFSRLFLGLGEAPATAAAHAEAAAAKHASIFSYPEMMLFVLVVYCILFVRALLATGSFLKALRKLSCFRRVQ